MSRISMAFILSCTFVLPTNGQSPLRAMQRTQASVSQLDWVLLKASVAHVMLSGVGKEIQLLWFYYDPIKDRIIGTALVSPEWLKMKNIDQLKTEFVKVAIAYDADITAAIEQATGEKLMGKNRNYFSAEFKSFNSKGERYDVATWDLNAGVILK